MIYREPRLTYRSAFKPYIEAFIRFQKVKYQRYPREAAYSLKRFDEYCVKNKVTEVVLKNQLVSDWISSMNLGQNDLCNYYKHMGAFADYLFASGVAVDWQRPINYGRRMRKYTPYYFTTQEIKDIFNVADNLRVPYGKSRMNLIFPVILRLYYCCGLRESEPLNLKLGDVDLENGIICILETKFGKERRIPLPKSLAQTMRNYYFANKDLIGITDEAYFFPNQHRERYSDNTIYWKFRDVLKIAKIPHGGRGKGPRIHDLRHTFAIRSLKKSVDEGKDPYAALPYLMTYMGHSDITHTEYYLRMTADIYPDILAKIEATTKEVTPERRRYE